jgi:hypothetical protein
LITVIEVFVCLFFFAGKYLQFVAGYLREKKVEEISRHLP